MAKPEDNGKFVYVRRVADGKKLDMREVEWEETQKTRKDQFILLGPVGDPMTDHKEIAPPKSEPADFQCPLCGKTVKTAAALTKHKATHA